MKKILAVVFSILLPLTACAEKFEEDKHYKVLPIAATKTPEVKEFFSFYCPHCFAFEPYIDTIKKSLPADVKFSKSHVDFMPRNNREVAQGLSKTMGALQILKQEEKAVSAIFNHIHTDRKSFSSMTDVRGKVVGAGVDPKKYDAAYSSFVVSGMANQMKNEQKKFRIDSVPTVVVNGKYKVILGSVKTEAAYAELVNYLLTKK